MIRTYLGGAAVQVSIFAALASQALLAPRILGAEAYGRAVGALALAMLAQAAIETVVFALTIQWATGGRDADLRRLWLDALAAGPLLGLFAIAVSLHSAAAPVGAERWAFAAGTPLLLLAWAAANALMGTAYGLHRHAAIARTYLLSAVVLPASIWALRSWGASSFLLGMVIDKLVGIGSLYLDAPVRGLWQRVVAGASAPLRLRPALERYLPVLTPRLTLLLLSPALVALAAVVMPPVRLAGLKVSLSLVSGAAMLVPVSQYVLQAHWRDRADRREVRRVLALVLLAGCVFALALFRFGDAIRAQVLRTADPSLGRFDIIFAGVPLYVLIGPLSSFLVARGRLRTLGLAFAAAAVGLAVAAIARGPEMGFLVGTAAFTLLAAAAVVSPAKQ